MLITLLILSVVFTMVAVVAEANPPNPKPTKVVVEVREDNSCDEDPPTVVALPKSKSPPPMQKETYSAAKLRILELWTSWSPHIENAVGAISIIAIMWLGWLWAYLMEG